MEPYGAPRLQCGNRSQIEEAVTPKEAKIGAGLKRSDDKSGGFTDEGVPSPKIDEASLAFDRFVWR
jgi:hypothetical protein